MGSHSWSNSTVNAKRFGESLCLPNATDSGIENTYSQAATFQDLPTELILHIFSYLNHKELCQSVSSVCKSWHELFLDPSLWRILKIHNNCWQTSVKTRDKMMKLLSRCTELNELTLRGHEIKYSCHKAILDIPFPCRKLRSLVLNETRLCKQFLREQSIESPLLESLVLRESTVSGDACYLAYQFSLFSELRHLDVCGNSVSLDDKDLEVILLKCKRLRSLFVNSVQVSDQSLHFLASCCGERIKALSLNTCSITSEGIKALSRCSQLVELRLTGRIANKRTLDALDCLDLQTLYLNHHYFYYEGDSVTSSELVGFLSSPRRKSLRKLSFCRFKSFDNECLRILATNYPMLNKLGIYVCEKVTSEGVETFLESVPEHFVLNTSCSPFPYSKIYSETGSLLTFNFGKCIFN